jgi:hypothetical protein
MNRLKFSREKLSKHPDVVGQSCRHSGRALLPLWLNHSFAYPVLRGDLHPQTHVGSREVVEGLKKDYSPSPLLARLAKGAALTHQGGQCVPEGLIEAFDQTGANLQSQPRQLLCAQHDSLAQGFQSSFLFLLDHLGIDQLLVRLRHRFARSASLAGVWELLDLMIDSNQSRPVATEPAADVTPMTKLILLRLTLHSRSLSTMITFSSGVRRSKKTLWRVSKKEWPHKRKPYET